MTHFPPKIIALAAFLLVGAIVALFALDTPSVYADGGTVVAGECAIASEGRIVCWGYGPIADNSPIEGAFDQISNHRRASCLRAKDGTIECFGEFGHWGGAYGPLGNDYVSMSSSDTFACGVTSTGGVVCVGLNHTDFLKHGYRAPFGRYTQVSAAAWHACALTTSGTVRCWGHDSDGNLEAPTGSDYVQISVKDHTSCALASDGRIECWGNNDRGQLNAPTDANYVTINIRDYPCAISKQGGIVCWGTEGVETIADSGYTYVSRIGATLCAITTDAALECFGSGNVVPPPELTQAGAVLQPAIVATQQGNRPRGNAESPSVHPILTTAARLSGPTGGTVSSTATDLPAGSAVTLTANPDDGYRFLRWEGDASGNQNPLTITLSDHTFVSAIFEPIESVESEPPSVVSRRADLFASRIVADQNWQIGQSVNLTLPSATGGSGFFTYSIKYEWNGDQTWRPRGVSFDQNTLRFFGSPSMALDPNPALRRFTAFLRAEDRLRPGEWDELALVVNLRPAPIARPRPATSETISALIVARRLADGRIEFALEPAGGDRILPRSRRIPVSPTVGRWINTSNVVYEGQTLGQISARRLADGRTEFGFLPTSASERLLPESRTFPSGTKVTNWLRSGSIEIPIGPAALPSSSTGCRTVGPIANGIAFPERRVKLSPDSSTTFRVRGVGTTGGSVTYYVCGDDRSISDLTRDRAIFTAGYFRTTSELAGERQTSELNAALSRIRTGYDIADASYDKYIESIGNAGLAVAVKRGLHFMGYVLLANNVADVGSTALLEEAKSIGLSTTLSLSQQVLDAILRQPEEVVKQVAWQHVQAAHKYGHLWHEETAAQRNGDSVLLFDLAALYFGWEDDIARGRAGRTLDAAVADSEVRLWEQAVSSIPLGIGMTASALFALSDLRDTLTDAAFTSVHERFLEYSPYANLSVELASANSLVQLRRDALFERLGITAAVLNR